MTYSQAPLMWARRPVYRPGRRDDASVSVLGAAEPSWVRRSGGLWLKRAEGSAADDLDGPRQRPYVVLTQNLNLTTVAKQHMWGSLMWSSCAPVQGCCGGSGGGGGTSQGVRSTRSELPPGATERESASEWVSEICLDLGSQPGAVWLSSARLFPHQLRSQSGRNLRGGTVVSPGQTKESDHSYPTNIIGS